MTRRSSEGLDGRRRRLLFRAWHRGMQEADLITGPFADAHIATFTERELAEFEQLLEVPCPQLVSWVMGQFAPTAAEDTALLRRLCQFHNAKMVG